ncbi:MAG: hypothetical protein ACREB6_09200, partial [Rhodospirillales bacterium]
MSYGAAQDRVAQNVAPVMESTRFTPTYRRSHTTKKSVLIADKIADVSISLGGILVIVAVFGIMIFLAQVVVPLFAGATAGKSVAYDLKPIDRVSFANVDEYWTLGVRLAGDGRVGTFHVQSGKSLAATIFDFGARRITGTGATLKRDT